MGGLFSANSEIVHGCEGETVLCERAAIVLNKPAGKVLLLRFGDSAETGSVGGGDVNVRDWAIQVQSHAPDGGVEIVVVGSLRESHLRIVTRKRPVMFNLVRLVERVEVEGGRTLALQGHSVVSTSLGDLKGEAECVEKALLHLLHRDALTIAVDEAMVGTEVC